jgi:uncharacterized protein YijF (DUF1287 family)
MAMLCWASLLWTQDSVDVQALVVAARSQVGVTKGYDGSYVRLAYPGGDVPESTGVCTDVIVRALRHAAHIDLQQLVHDDMREHFQAYPNLWNLTKADSNIDHRRVPNLQCYFTRKGYAVPMSQRSVDYHAGDVVTCMVGTRPHIMLVSDRSSAAGIPLIIHNIGAGTQEEDQLFAFPQTGHYRFPKTTTP